MPYHPLAIELKECQAKRAMKGGAIKVAPSQIGRSTLIVHPVNKKKIEKAILKNKSIILELSPAELAETALHHIKMNGGGFWNNIWRGLKKSWGFLKDSGIASKAFDAAVPAVANLIGAPTLAEPVRQLVKKTTGAGLKLDKLKASGLYLS